MKLDAVNSPRGIDAFASVRAECIALREVLVPDSIWPDFATWHETPDGVALHRSALLLAMERGTLAKLTAPVHRYLTAKGDLRTDIAPQYVHDLRETWMLSDDYMQRHRSFRTFAGRLCELLFADWLTTQGWTVRGLEALGASLDVVACSPDGTTVAFEVKHIGVQDDDFANMLRSYRGVGGAASVSPYDAADYLLLRVYEAAKQLIRASTKSARIAAVVIPSETWHRFDVQLMDGWIDWRSPNFYATHDMAAFIRSQQTKYPDLPADLAATLGSIDSVWILSDRATGDIRLEWAFDVRCA